MATKAAPTSIYTLLAEAQAEMGQPVKDQTATVRMKTGGTYSYKYSSLASIEGIVKPPLNKRGVFVGQRTVCHDQLGACIQTYVCWGSTEDGDIEVILDHEPYFPDRDPKENGSRTTYAKRYGMCKAFCLEGMEDGDIQGIDPQGNPMQPYYPRQEGTKANPTPYQGNGGTNVQKRQEDPRKQLYAQIAGLKMKAMELGASEADVDAWYKSKFGDAAINRLEDSQIQELIGFLNTLIETCKQNGGNQ